MEWRVFCCRFLLEYFQDRGFISFSDYDGNAWFDDACFFRCDLLDRVTQKLGVIEADVCDYAQNRRNNVGAVQSTS